VQCSATTGNDFRMSAEDPLVSVIIPTTGRSAYLEAAIESVELQSYSRWEIVLVRDGRDDTVGIDSLLSRHANIRTVSQEHLGVSVARNRGIQHARGRYVTFLDDDDLFPRDRLAKQIEVVRTNTNAIGCFGQHEYVDGNTDSLGTFDPGTFSNPARSAGFHLGTLLVPRQIAVDAGGFNPLLTTAQDLDFCIRVGSLGELLFVPDVLYRYRRHQNNRTNGRSGVSAPDVRQSAREVHRFYLGLAQLNRDFDLTDGLVNKVSSDARYFYRESIREAIAQLRSYNVYAAGGHAREAGKALSMIGHSVGRRRRRPPR